MPLWLAVLPILATGPEIHYRDEATVHRVTCAATVNGKCMVVAQNNGGAGGSGGNVSGPTFYAPGAKFYFPSTAGNGAKGGDVSSDPQGRRRSSDGPASSGVSRVERTTEDETTISKIARCSLKIAGKTVVKGSGCSFTRSDKKITFRSGSGRKVYVATLVLNEDKTGLGYLVGGRSSAERGLGLFTPHGACWRNEDRSVEMCAWR